MAKSCRLRVVKNIFITTSSEDRGDVENTQIIF